MRIEEVADGLSSRSETPLRRAFAKHLKLVAQAMHDIEWVDSCDYGKGDEDAAIRKVLGANSKAEELSVLKEDAEQVIRQLKELI